MTEIKKKVLSSSVVQQTWLITAINVSISCKKILGILLIGHILKIKRYLKKRDDINRKLNFLLSSCLHLSSKRQAAFKTTTEHDISSNRQINYIMTMLSKTKQRSIDKDNQEFPSGVRHLLYICQPHKHWAKGWKFFASILKHRKSPEGQVWTRLTWVLQNLTAGVMGNSHIILRNVVLKDVESPQACLREGGTGEIR